MAQPNLLRPITQRLVSTPVQQLPQIAYFLASSISTCSQILKAPGGIRGDEVTLLIHKLKSRLTSLLQDRSPEGRFAAVVLIKATIEAGGVENLGTCEPWIRGLIGILNKPDPVPVKKLCIITVARAFSLTQSHPSLLREITSPLLPAFVTACFSLIRPKAIEEAGVTSTILSPLLIPVLQSWLQLLPQNPTTFRPFILRIQAVCVSLIGDQHTPDQVAGLASGLLASLHLCASKNSSTPQWIQFVQEIISQTHETTNHVYNPVLEDWVSSDSALNKPTEMRGAAANESSVISSLPKLSGMHSSANRLKALLLLLSNLLSHRTAESIPIPLGSILNLTTRLTSVTVPFISKDSSYTVRFNQEVGKDEREQLWTELPDIHLACLRLLTVVAKTLGPALSAVCGSVSDQVVWIFGASIWHSEIRESVYVLIAALLPLVGSSLTRVTVKPFYTILQHCCSDLVSQSFDKPKDQIKSQKSSQRTQSKVISTASVESFLSTENVKSATGSDLESCGVQRAASDLLPLVFRHLPTDSIPQQLRTDLDRTAILLHHREAILASVLNPPPKQKGRPGPPSLLPFLAREFNGDDSLEAVLRPRMPVVDNTLHATDEIPVEDGENGWIDGSPLQRSPSGDLSQLENSLERNVVGDAKESEIVARSLEQVRQQPIQTMSLLKRDFAAFDHSKALGDQDGVDSVSMDLVDFQKIGKRPRLEETSLPGPTVNTALATEPDAPAPPLAKIRTVSEDIALSAEISTFQGASSSRSVPLEGEDGGSSDSEIPAIDIELDTEDEEDIEANEE